jgi:hypothetical protein
MTSNRVFFISKYLFDNRYKIDRLEEEKKLIIDAEIKICFEKEVCSSSFKVFDQQLIPQPLCDMEMGGQLLGILCIYKAKKNTLK